MIRTLLRMMAIVFLAVLTLYFAARFLEAAFQLLLVAIPLVLVVLFIKWIWSRSRRADEEEEEETRFSPRFRSRLSRINRRLKGLEKIMADRAKAERG